MKDKLSATAYRLLVSALIGKVRSKNKLTLEKSLQRRTSNKDSLFKKLVYVVVDAFLLDRPFQPKTILITLERGFRII